MTVLSARLTSPEGARPRSLPSPSPWLSVVTHTDPRYGGLSAAVPRSGVAVTETDRFDVSLAAFCLPGEHTAPAKFDEAHLSFWPVSRASWLRSSSLRSRFRDLVRQADGVHLHGLWEVSTAVGSRTARQLGKPYLVSAHGMLEPWALANKRWKKRIYAQLIEREILVQATCLHALTEAEALQYRAFGTKAPIAIVPNAVEIPEALSPELFLSTYPQLEGKRLVLFLGRLHPKKGLELLSGAWRQICRAHPEAHLVLAGPDAEGTAGKFAAEMEAAGTADTVTFTGMLREAMKWSALAAAECFVLPSYSEGLSMGVLEALGAGVPVIVTRNCNMPEVAQHGAGWVIEPDQEELEAALEALLGRKSEENRAAGERGAALITSRYNSRHVAEKMADIYEYVRTGIPPSTTELLT